VELLFIVRLWREEGAPLGAIRGTVREVGGALEFAFAELGELEDFLRWRQAARNRPLPPRKRVRARRFPESG
jgi:hypothetical protein